MTTRLDEPLIVDGRADVSRIMVRIREDIRRRHAHALAAGGVEEAARLRLQALTDEADLDSELLARLLETEGGWNVSPDYRIRTHRRGLSRRLVLLLKSLVRPVVRLYTDQVLERQAQINAYVVHLSRGLLRELIRLEASHAALLQRCEELERRLEALEPRREGPEGRS